MMDRVFYSYWLHGESLVKLLPLLPVIDQGTEMPTSSQNVAVPSPEAFAQELQQRLASADGIDPKTLSELFRESGGLGAYPGVLRNVLQKLLFEYTHKHARQHTQYYKRSEYAEINLVAPEAPLDLSNLPLLRRETVVEHFDDFIADDVTIRSVCHTSGTTGTPLDLYKSHEEIAFIQTYYSCLFRPVVE